MLIQIYSIVCLKNLQLEFSVKTTYNQYDRLYMYAYELVLET